MKKVTTLLPIGPGANVDWAVQAINSTLSQDGVEHELLVHLDGYDLLLHDPILKAIPVHHCILVTSTQENQGVAKSLNRMIKWASGDYIARIDADDYSLPGRYRSQILALEEKHADICGSAMIWGSDNVIWPPYSHDTNSAKVAIMQQKVPIFHPTLFCKTEVLKDNLYPERYEWAEDYALHCKLLKCGYEYTNVIAPLVYYRRHSGQSSLIHKKEQIKNTLKALNAKKEIR